MSRTASVPARCTIARSMQGCSAKTTELDIVRAKALESRLDENESLARVFGPPMLRKSLLVPETAQQPRHQFLEYHQTLVFRG